MEMFLLTSVVVVLFIVFIITSWKELNKATSPEYKPNKQRLTSGRYAVMNFIENSTKPKERKKSIKL